MKIKRGSTSVRRLIFVADSSSTTGAGLANLVYNTASLVAYYFAADLANEVQITLATATLGTFASGGFVAVDNTNMPGWYEIGIPDVALDGGNECAIQFRGAANMVPVNIYIELDAFDYQTATQPVNATQFAGQTITAAAGVTIPSAIASPTNITAGTITTVTTLTGHTPQTGDSFARIGALGAGLTSLAPSATALSTAVWTATIVGRIDVAVSTRLAPLVAGRDISVAATTGAVELDPATATQIDNIEATLTTLGSESTTVERSVSDTNAITFSWPVSGATITGTASLNNGTYGAVAGAIAFLRTETGRHYYTLAYNAADRTSAEGQVRYKFVDGTYTGYVVLRTVNLVTVAQVNAQVLDVLSVDTFAELSAPPAATSSLKDKLTWLFMYARNKVTQTATTRTLYRDDTTTVAGTSGTSDNGTTFTKGEDA